MTKFTSLIFIVFTFMFNFNVYAKQIDGELTVQVLYQGETIMSGGVGSGINETLKAMMRYEGTFYWCESYFVAAEKRVTAVCFDTEASE